ncbi:unnamed protein product [Prorocentrum cordatum]|uniref:Uncharacterized protein n=1 Tax=Prorocentrum cordatum TaxID=2364126 RepID=A0ABN9TL26_9DINO|nr:unnamed protein product [Polarella glacialis]
MPGQARPPHCAAALAGRARREGGECAARCGEPAAGAASSGEAVLLYGQDRYPFVGAMASVLEEPAGADLGKLHEGRLGREILENFRRQPAMLNLGPRGNPWHSELC